MRRAVAMRMRGGKIARMRTGLALLATLLVLAASESALARSPNSGLAGRVLEGPTCPVERVPPQPRCAPRPLVATLRIRRLGSRRPARSVRSRNDGRFRVSLAPGAYVVQALPVSSSLLPRPPSPFRVEVRRGRFTAVTISYDTGIR
jgi:hypothetical protein